MSDGRARPPAPTLAARLHRAPLALALEGRVSTAVEGGFDLSELREAIERALPG